MKILIAEDDAVCRFLLEATLRKLGHEVVAAENGQAAWEAYQEEHFSLLITDWMMPDVDGLELCRMIRAEKRARYTYVILLTVLGGKGSYLEGMHAGADDFITKPLDEDQLAARLRVADRVLRLQTEVIQLQGLLPICAYCKKVRDERDQWASIEAFIACRTEAQFSHGICPECFESHVAPQLARASLPASAFALR